MMVLLEGGPFDGAKIDVAWGTPLIVEGAPLPDGMVARYRKTLRRGVYRFRDYDRVVARLPEIGSDEGAA